MTVGLATGVDSGVGVCVSVGTEVGVDGYSFGVEIVSVGLVDVVQQLKLLQIRMIAIITRDLLPIMPYSRYHWVTIILLNVLSRN